MSGCDPVIVALATGTAGVTGCRTATGAKTSGMKTEIFKTVALSAANSFSGTSDVFLADATTGPDRNITPRLTGASEARVRVEPVVR